MDHLDLSASSQTVKTASETTVCQRASTALTRMAVGAYTVLHAGPRLTVRRTHRRQWKRLHPDTSNHAMAM
jgi:hypothetical protein